MPKVSVIVPAYNAEKYISRCLESILCQSFSDFELLIINDGSTDGTARAVENYRVNDSRVVLFTQSNSGVSSARMRGVSMSKGEWVTFVDADDVLLKDALEVLIAHSLGVDLVNAAFISTNGKVWKSSMNGVMSRDEYIKSLLDSSIFGVPYAKLFKRRVLSPDVFAFPPDIKIGEDVLMNLKVAQNISSINNISNAVYSYCNNNTSTMATYSRSVLYYIRYFDIRNQFLDLEYQLYSLQYDIDIIIKAFFDENIPYKKKYLHSLRKYLDSALTQKCNFTPPIKVKYIINREYTILTILIKCLYYYKALLIKMINGDKIRKVLN